MHDTQLDTAAYDCPCCGSPITDANAYTFTFYDALFRCCSKRCKTVWRAVLLGRQNCEGSIYGQRH
jgi:hypothetical protein